jgi:hypothetical protein
MSTESGKNQLQEAFAQNGSYKLLTIIHQNLSRGKFNNPVKGSQDC